jgi:hypothetical protein
MTISQAFGSVVLGLALALPTILPAAAGAAERSTDPTVDHGTARAVGILSDLDVSYEVHANRPGSRPEQDRAA